MTSSRHSGKPNRPASRPPNLAENEAARAQRDTWALLSLLADIRGAVGDPYGKLMQDELVARCQCMREALEKLRDCDWVISLPDRMDAVREIARKALQMPGGEDADRNSSHIRDDGP